MFEPIERRSGAQKLCHCTVDALSPHGRTGGGQVCPLLTLHVRRQRGQPMTAAVREYVANIKA